jgi:hypothetical protein
MFEESPQPAPNLALFSFWKPEPLPPKDSTILPIELCSLGTLSNVAEKLLNVPHMHAVPPAPWDEKPGVSLNLMWDVEDGVMLKARTEQGPPKPGEVLTIHARADVAEKIFYRLYVQIFEQFGATVLDEKCHEFLTPREFRTRLAG